MTLDIVRARAHTPYMITTTATEAITVPDLRLVDALACCNGCDFEDALDNPMGYGPDCLSKIGADVDSDEETEAHDAALAARREAYAAAPSRDETIARIRKALRARTGQSWSVTGGRGTVWGWIKINALPARQESYGVLTGDDQATLARALGLTRVHHQGVSIPAGGDYYAEFIDRAEGREPSIVGTPYWD